MVIMLCPNVIYYLILFSVTPLINLPDILTNSFLLSFIEIKVAFYLTALMFILGESTMKLSTRVYFEHLWCTVLEFIANLLPLLILLQVLDVPNHSEINYLKQERSS